MSWESQTTTTWYYSTQSQHSSRPAHSSPDRMLKWLVTGREQPASQLAHKKITKKKSGLKHEASSEDGVAVIDNVKFNITR